MQRWLSALIRFRVVVVVVLGVTLFLPSLGMGFMADDWFHLAVIEDAEFMPSRSRFDLFSFVTDEDKESMVADRTLLPWWTSDGFRASFFRPLTSATHLIDHHIFGRFKVAHHGSSLLLWCLLLFVVLRFFETLARDSGRGPVVVLLAGLIYALDDAHTWNIAWLANRNALLCVGFALLSLWLYHLYRRDGGVGLLIASLSSYLLALLSGETAIALPMWVLAYELCLGQGAPAQRLRAALPFFVSSTLYLFAWSYFGYGASGSNLYLSPFEVPGAFVWEALFERIPLLVTGALWPIPAEISFLFPEHDGVVRATAWLCGALASPSQGPSVSFLRSGCVALSHPYGRYLCPQSLASLCDSGHIVAACLSPGGLVCGASCWAGGCTTVVASEGRKGGGLCFCRSLTGRSVRCVDGTEGNRGC